MSRSPLPLRFARTLSALAVAACAAGALAPAPAVAGRLWPETGEVRLAVADGALSVALRPDRGRPLLLVRDGTHRWVFTGDTDELVGEPYSIVLRNETSERLKVVVGVDGLNVYERELVAGNAREDVGSILAPYAERVLRGWQIGDDRAQRFVFSPNEWSEGQGRTEPSIGLVTVEVYREWRAPPWHRRDREWRDGAAGEGPAAAQPHARPAPQPEAAPSEAREGAQDAAPPRAARPREPIGTTAGEDEWSAVRTVRFTPASVHPEAWAELDYGGAGEPGPRGYWPEDDVLGLRLAPGRDGARVVDVAPGSAAARAGLVPDDVIVRLDTLHAPSPGEARRLLRAKDRGDYAFLRVRRGPHEMAVKIRV